MRMELCPDRYRASVKHTEGMYNLSSPAAALSAKLKAAGSCRCAGAAYATTQFVSTKTCFISYALSEDPG